MSYMAVLSRLSNDVEEWRKSHPIPETIKEIRQKTSEETEQLREQYDILKETFRNFRELWNEGEICMVYNAFVGSSEKQTRKIAYQTAMKLERTKSAVIWMKCHIFSDKTDLHRGIEVIEFRKKMGLDKCEEYHG